MSIQRKLVVEFTKMNGAGNDFIVLDNRFYYFSNEELQSLARQYCPRRTGIGADGLLALLPADEAQYHYRMKYFNADGSLGTMCGNGARCLAQFAKAGGIVGNSFVFESDAGIYKADVFNDEPVRIYVAPPKHDQFDVLGPIDLESSNIQACHYIWTGTEHVVCEVDSAEQAAVEEKGKEIRHHTTFAPAGANVNFVEQRNATTLRVRTFEKGVEAETLACGTGAIASAIMAYRRGKVNGQAVSVEMRGGTLRVGFSDSGGIISDVWLEGPTETVYRGTIEV